MSQRKIMPRDEMMECIRRWRKDRLSIVFTNGCFDIVHLGHIDYLEKARNLGDRLIVALNTDQSIAQIKGPERPMINQYSRARLLAALEFVDIVVLFDELTPIQLIQDIQPDILVKGGDYKIETIIGANLVVANGGAVRTIPLVEGYSTTALIASIRKLSNDNTSATVTNKITFK